MKLLLITIFLTQTTLSFSEEKPHPLFEIVASEFAKSDRAFGLTELASDYECMIVSATTHQKVLGSHTLKFGKYFDYQTVDMRLNSGQPISSFIVAGEDSSDPNSFFIEEVPNFPRMRYGARIYLRSLGDKLFLEWTLSGDDYVYIDNDFQGRASFHRVETFLPSSYSTSKRRAIFYSECRIKGKN